MPTSKALLCFVIAALGCGGTTDAGDTTGDDSSTTADSSGVDAPKTDTTPGGDTSIVDSTTTDTATSDSTTSDTTTSDTTTSDTATTDSGDGATCGCKPSWCGCGACNPKDVVCSTDDHGCPLGCAGSCAVLTTPGVCTCSGDRCVRNIPGTTEVACYKTKDCPPGFCCTGTFTPPTGHGTCTTMPSGGCPP